MLSAGSSQVPVLYTCSVTRSNSSVPRTEPTRILSIWEFPGKNARVGCHSLLQGTLPNPGIEPASPAPAGRFFTTEPPRKPYFVCNNVNRSIPISQCIPPSLSPMVTISLFFTSVTLFLFANINKFICTIFPNISDIMGYLSLSDLLHLV